MQKSANSTFRQLCALHKLFVGQTGQLQLSAILLQHFRQLVRCLWDNAVSDMERKKSPLVAPCSLRTWKFLGRQHEWNSKLTHGPVYTK
jgi:hypothetical protein